jgi:hypothetical protein
MGCQQEFPGKPGFLKIVSGARENFQYEIGICPDFFSISLTFYYRPAVPVRFAGFNGRRSRAFISRETWRIVRFDRKNGG